MKFFYDPDKTKEIEAKILSKFESEQHFRDEVHLSDTCHCPAKCFNRLIGMDKVEDGASIGYMVIGTVGQLAIQVLYPKEQTEYESTDIVPSHVDIFEDFEHPIEIKWSSQKIFRATDIPKGWRLQLMRYMAKHNANVGWMLVMNLFSRQFMAFKMLMDADERMEQIIQMYAFKELIAEAKRLWDDGKHSEAYAMLKVEQTEEQRNECKSCYYRPSRKRAQQNMGEGCPHYIKTLA